MFIIFIHNNYDTFVLLLSLRFRNILSRKEAYRTLIAFGAQKSFRDHNMIFGWPIFAIFIKKYVLFIVDNLFFLKFFITCWKRIACFWSTTITHVIIHGVRFLFDIFVSLWIYFLTHASGQAKITFCKNTLLHKKYTIMVGNIIQYYYLLLNYI